MSGNPDWPDEPTWTAEDEALADSLHENQQHIKRVGNYECAVTGCHDVRTEGAWCVKHNIRQAS